MAVHIERLEIAKFKGILDLNIKDLNHINIIAGDNNVGKTSILEAIMLFRRPDKFENILQATSSRSRSAFGRYYEGLVSIFPKGLSDLEMLVAGVYKDKTICVNLKGETGDVFLTQEDMMRASHSPAQRAHALSRPDGIRVSLFQGVLSGNASVGTFSFSVELDAFTRPPNMLGIKNHAHVNISYLSPAAHITQPVFDNIVGDDGYKNICIQVLKTFDHDIEDLLYLKDELTGRPQEYVKHATLGNMPLSSYGDGIRKVLSLAGGVAKAKDGILLIDEIETSLYIKYYSDIFQFLIKACRAFNVQLFITTHSIEAIDALLKAQSDAGFKDEGISVITLQKETAVGPTYCRVLPGRRVANNRENFRFEARA